MVRSTRATTVLAGIAAIFLLYWGAPFFVPLCVALLISYALAPVVNALTVLVRVRIVAASVVVAAVLALIGLGAWSWSDDVMRLWDEAPVAAKVISKSLQKYVKPAGPLTDIKKAAVELENVAQTGTATTPPAAPAPPPAASQVSMWQLVWTGWKNVMLWGSQVMVVAFLVLFMLSSGDLFKRKLLSIAAERNKTRFTLNVLEEIDAQIRRYLIVLLVANLLVGLGTWLAFMLLGVKNAGLWGLVAGVLHTAPYFGPAIVAMGSFVAAFVQFEAWSKAALAAGSTILVAALVGQLFATWLASRQTRMNTTATFIGLLFFGWLWGFWGILLGIPLLAIVKTVCDHNEDWKPVAELLGR